MDENKYINTVVRKIQRSLPNKVKVFSEKKVSSNYKCSDAQVYQVALAVIQRKSQISKGSVV